MPKDMIAPKDAEDLNLNELQPQTDYTDPDAVFQKSKGICVVLEEDTDKKDLIAVIEAISLLKGVAVVKYIDLDSFHDYSNRVRAQIEMREKIEDILDLNKFVRRRK